MKNSKKKMVLVFIICMLLGMTSGCGQKLTEDDIKRMDTYQDLQTKYNQLERKYDKAQKSNMTADEKTALQNQKAATEFLNQIKNSNFIKVRYLNNEDSKYEISDNLSLCKWLQKQIAKACLDENQDVAKWQQKNTAKFVYTLYNEDQSVCQMTVYEGNYVIFADLPDALYYVPEVCRLGKGTFVDSTQTDIAKQSLYYDLFSSPIAFKDQQVMSVEDIQAFAAKLSKDQMKKLDVKPADVESSSISELIFKKQGKTYVIEVYGCYISVVEDQMTTNWYAIEADKVQNLLANE